MRELKLTVQGDLKSRSDLRSFSVVAVVVMALLVGLSLMVMARVVMPMVVEVLSVGLTLMEEQRSAMTMMKNNIICNTPTAGPLAYLRRGIPIMGVPVHPRRGGGVIFFCCSSEVLMVI